MRTNLPVSQVELVLPDDTMIVTKTDLKGRITYVNRDFIEISGYTEAELLGQPHNIVRHPDMPPEAFEDLWHALGEQRPWVGYVKNRRKNGDFYWVEAHAAPIWEGQQVTGYMSVRRKAARDKIEAAEAAYRLVRERRQGARVIKDGAVQSSRIWARAVQRLQETGIAMKMVLASALGVLLVMGGMSWLLGARLGSSLEQQGLIELTQNLKLIRGMIEVRAAAMNKEATRLSQIFLTYFDSDFSLEVLGDAPVLKSGNKTLNGRFLEPDRFTAATGATASVFVLQGDEFVRIASSFKDADGNRATAPLSKDSLAYANLAAGKPYVGQSKMVGKDLYASYLPIRADDGPVIGAISIGLDVSAEIEALKQHIRAVKVGQTGYFYVLDGNPGKDFGTLIVHPAKEGANQIAAKDAGGREFIREILEKKQGTIRYPWMNKELGESSAREKVVVFDTFPEWRWTIGGGTYLDEFEAMSRSMSQYLWVATMIVMLMLIAMITLLVNKIIRAPLRDQVLPAFRALSGGNYDTRLDVSRRDEIGQVLQGLETMQNRLGFEVSETKRTADEMTRVKIALDNVSTGVMITNPKRTIIYANNSVKRILKDAEPEIRKQIPGFDADKLEGANIDSFHRNPQHQAELLSSFMQPYKARLQIGNCHMTVTANPVISASGERLGAVAEWRDKTDEVLIEQEIADIVAAAGSGDLDKRVVLDGKDGFFAAIGQGINNLLVATHAALSTTSVVLNRVATGDLSRTVEQDFSGLFGQLKDDTNSTVMRLREVVGRIKEAADAINTASQEIAAGNQDLSSRTEQQASSLQETASSMEELNATVKQNAENARQANELARKSNDAVTRGGDAVKRVVSTMGDIQNSSRKIADIISVIDSIAFQTNILALNAAVEAARAGEQGRGFAVVATEVRNLAQRSATAAKEIKELIAESVTKVDGGAKLVAQAGSAMDEVVLSFHHVAELMAEIANASREQATGIEQVTRAVGQMDEVTQQNAALVEQAAAAAESLEEQAQSLVQSVGMFKLADSAIEGNKAVPGPALRDATPKRLPQHRSTKPALPPAAVKKLAPAHHSVENDDWEEF